MSDVTLLTDDRFYCTVEKLVQFKKSDVWRELTSWIDKRREEVADKLDNVTDPVEVKLIACERRVLRDMLELPDLALATLQLKESNAEAQQEGDKDARAE